MPESADWYESTYMIVWGTNLPMTRSPDAHFFTEARYRGARVCAVAPDYAEYVKFADTWLPARAGTDAAADPTRQARQARRRLPRIRSWHSSISWMAGTSSL